MPTKAVKGSHVVQLKDWVDDNLGIDSFADLAKPYGERWSVVLPVAWYEIDVLVQIYKEVSFRTGLSVEAISTQVSRINAERDLTSIYRLFMRAAQPKLLLDHTPKLWRTYVNYGNAAAVKNTRGYYVGQADGFEEAHITWVCGCWLGFIPAAIRLAGGRDPRGKIAKRWRDADGTYAMQLEVNYG